MARIGLNVKRAAALGIVAAICAHAYVRSGRGPNRPYFVGDPGQVKVFVNSQTQAGLQSSDGATIISSDSAPTAAILAALDRWSSIPGSMLRFDMPASVATTSGATDGQSVITFADTLSNRSITGGAVAVTRLISDSTGELTDTDIIFNPQFEFSTTLRPDTFDIEGTLVHELGHAIGMGHSASVASSMFATTALASADSRTLTEDDDAYPRGIYPAPGPSSYGSLFIDTRVVNGPAADGVLVVAIDPDQNILLTGLSDTSGRAEIRGVPTGKYILYAEPANEPALPYQFGQFGVRDSFRTALFGGPDFPFPLLVEPNSETAATIAVQSGVEAVNIVGAGGAEEGDFIESDYGLLAHPGGHYVFEIYGDGLDAPALTLSSISFLGTGVSVTGPFERDEVEFFNGQIYPLLRFRIDVAPTAPIGSLSIMVRLGEEVSFFTGAIEIANPTPTPSFPSNGVVHAASFDAVSLSPGGIFSIFGADLARAEGSGFFDPLSGGLIELLRNTTVLVNRKPAPLFYVSPGQINAQAPADLEPGSFVTVQVLRDDAASPIRILPVASAAPGVFVHPESNRAVVLNQDGSLNSAVNAADRDSVVTIYLTGAGLVAPAIATGRPAPLPPPLSHVIGGVTATIDGQPAQVEFAGAAPGFVGLIQVNVRIPATSPVGGAVELRVLASGTASRPGTTISIR